MYEIKQHLVATLISNPARFPLTPDEVNSVVDALQHQGAVVEAVEPLAEQEAYDIFFAILPLDEAQEVLHALLESVPVDVVVQPVAGRQKKLLISDMDSTMIHQECIDELADCLGIKPHIAAITERAMNGELDFPTALKERVALLKNLPEAELQRVFDEKITFMEGAETLVRLMKAHGARTVLVSGGFTFFTTRVAEHLGFDVQEANILEVANGKLTGTVQLPILDSTAKRNALYFHAEDHGIRMEHTLAVGDGANDLPMILEAGLGVAFHAKPAVQAKALAAGKATLRHSDLTALLYAQGYSKNW